MKGLLFTPENVRLILEGKKTQTRRVLYVPTKHLKSAYVDRDYQPDYGRGKFPNLPPGQAWTVSNWRRAKAGDLVYVRETFTAHWGPQLLPTSRKLTAPVPIKQKDGSVAYPSEASPLWIIYRATDSRKPEHLKWRPSIFMPEWASRTTLELTEDARIERLQSITSEDARAEGANLLDVRTKLPIEPHRRTYGASFVTGYKKIWQGINGKGPHDWHHNPWVIVLTFKMVAP